MLPDLLLNYTNHFQPLNLFNYISFRAIGALLTALLISFIFGPSIISLLKRTQKRGQPIRTDGPKNHIIFKTGTPTMGGLLILLAFSISTILWARLDNLYIWVVLGVAILFGVIGLLDDWLKVSRMNSSGLKSYQKFIPQLCKLSSGNLSALYGIFISRDQPSSVICTLPSKTVSYSLPL